MGSVAVLLSQFGALMSFIFRTDGSVETTTLTDAIKWDRYVRAKTTDGPSAGPPDALGEKLGSESDISSLSEEGRWKRAMARLDSEDRALLADFLKESPLRSTQLKALIRKHRKGPAHYFDRVVKVVEGEGFSVDDVYKYEPTKKMSIYSAGRLLGLYGV